MLLLADSATTLQSTPTLRITVVSDFSLVPWVQYPISSKESPITRERMRGNVNDGSKVNTLGAWEFLVGYWIFRGVATKPR
jgi:hypothetical protein